MGGAYYDVIIIIVQDLGGVPGNDWTGNDNTLFKSDPEKVIFLMFTSRCRSQHVPRLYLDKANRK
jgi:hypothetical protein